MSHQAELLALLPDLDVQLLHAHRLCDLLSARLRQHILEARNLARQLLHLPARETAALAMQLILNVRAL